MFIICKKKQNKFNNQIERWWSDTKQVGGRQTIKQNN